MKFRRTGHFKKAYYSLPQEIREKVAKAFRFFQEDIHHPSLGIKKIQGAKGIWEGRIDRDYRFTFHYEKNADTGETICVFRNIDSHDECLNHP